MEKQQHRTKNLRKQKGTSVNNKVVMNEKLLGLSWNEEKDMWIINVKELFAHVGKLPRQREAF